MAEGSSGERLGLIGAVTLIVGLVSIAGAFWSIIDSEAQSRRSYDRAIVDDMDRRFEVMIQFLHRVEDKSEARVNSVEREMLDRLVYLQQRQDEMLRACR